MAPGNYSHLQLHIPTAIMSLKKLKLFLFDYFDNSHRTLATDSVAGIRFTY